VPHNGIEELPDPPNWRSFTGKPSDAVESGDAEDPNLERRLGTSHKRQPSQKEIQLVNAALFLRRPLLVTGDPGVGKSTLAYAVAHELGIGPVLRWPITTRSTLREGLYHYDPIGRLRDENLRRLRRESSPNLLEDPPAGREDDIGKHIRLGPLGTALLPRRRPRVLLIDEIDKSDIDLPNDLLNSFEEGEFEIEELTRLPAEIDSVEVMTADKGFAHIPRGLVRCHAFPFIVLTSNGEREFPAPFLRRCIRLDVQAPDEQQLVSILEAQLGAHAASGATQRITDFIARRDNGLLLTTDQLLNAVYLATSASGGKSSEELAEMLAVALEAVIRPLTQ
jgi:MoxR-like ATPase